MSVTDKTVMTLAEYMEDRRKCIDRYVEGEHKWYGDVTTSTLPLSMYGNVIPWYLKSTPSIKIECKGNN